jgi:hypothetical protein
MPNKHCIGGIFARRKSSFRSTVENCLRKSNKAKVQNTNDALPIGSGIRGRQKIMPTMTGDLPFWKKAGELRKEISE